MRTHRDPRTEPISAWYEISFKDPGAIIIRIHKNGFPDLEGQTWDTFWISERMCEKYGFTAFGSPEDEAWGFEKCLKRVDSTEQDWLCYELELPIYNSKDKKHVDDRKARMAARCTLSVLFLVLSLSESDTGSGRLQLLTIDGFDTREEMYGAALGAIVTPALSLWLSKQPNERHLEPVLEAMQAAFYHMWWERKRDSWGFSAVCRQPKWINLSVPGNACGLDPSNYHDTEIDVGYKLSPHNTDSGLQQFTLLAGLAKLCDLAREEKPRT